MKSQDKSKDHPIYEYDDAAKFIREHSGETEEAVQQFLESHVWYLTHRGKVTPGAKTDNVDVWTDSYPIDSENLLAARNFIVNRSRLDPIIVSQCLAEEVGYCASIGLVHPEAYTFAKDWAKRGTA